MRIPGALRLVEVSVVLQLVQVLALGNPEPRLYAPLPERYTFAPTVPEIIQSYGYPVESHEVITEDGYILTMHRIPYGVNETARTPGTNDGRSVAFLHHGLTSSSADYVVNKPYEALAFRLADSGYDVWMANCRGNQYSRAHQNLDTNSDEFWDFSWDQIAAYDIPAEVDFVLDFTGHDQLSYVGYSMGTTSFFAAASSNPDLRTKIKVMAGLAPASYMAHVQGLYKLIAQFGRLIGTFADLLNINYLVPGDDSLDEFIYNLCGAPYSSQMRTCLDFLGMLVGPEELESFQEILPLALTATPAGASVKSILHYAQLIISGEFHRFDHGSSRNMELYGQSYPPRYRLCQLTVPVALFYGDADFLATPEDAQRMIRELPNVIYTKYISVPHYNHVDFLWGRNANYLIYSDIIQIFDEYNS